MVSADNLTVLVVDPADDRRESTLADLQRAGPDLDLHGATGRADALATVEDTDVDAVVTAADLDGVSALDFGATIRDRYPDVPIVVHDDDLSRLDTAAHENVIVEHLPRSIADRGAALLTLVRDLVSEHRQVSYPVPDDERQRLATLRRYDLPSLQIQTTADRLSELARDHLDAAVGFVGVIDTHFEEFVGCAGADWGRQDREKTICTHTVFADRPLVVPDVQDDPRFAGIEWFDEGGIRSYAGVPIRAAEGDPIGSFCIVDDVVREFTDREVAVLGEYTDEFEEQLEMRHAILTGESSDILGSGHE
ncbi:MAG: GAF domain-containing protein [Halococcoides sp.]